MTELQKAWKQIYEKIDPLIKEKTKEIDSLKQIKVKHDENTVGMISIVLLNYYVNCIRRQKEYRKRRYLSKKQKY